MRNRDLDTIFKLTKYILALVLLLVLAYTLTYFKVLVTVGRIISALSPFLLAFLLSWLLHPLVERLQDLNVPKIPAILLSMLILIILMILILIVLTPVLNTTIQFLPTIEQDISSSLYSLEQWLNEAFDLELSFNTIVNDLTASTRLEELVTSVNNVIYNFFNFVTSLTFSLVLTFILLLNYTPVNVYIRRFMPQRFHAVVKELSKALGDSLVNFTYGILIESFVIGTFFTLFFMLINVEGAFVFGAYFGIFNIVLYIGPILALIPISIYLLVNTSVPFALFIILLIYVLQTLEKIFVKPYFIGNQQIFSPQVAIIGFLVAYTFFGLLGAVFAYPFILIVITLFRFYNAKYNFYKSSVRE